MGTAKKALNTAASITSLGTTDLVQGKKMFSGAKEGVQGLSDTLSGSTPEAQSFQERLSLLEQAGAFGGKSLAQYQQEQNVLRQQGLGTTQQGLGFSTQAAQNALSAMQGNQPSVAQLAFQQNLQNSIAAQQAAAQGGQVDAALAYRLAAEQADQQRQQALINSAMLRANEIAQARGELGQFGQNIANTGLGISGQGLAAQQAAMGTASGTEQSAAQQAFAAEQARANEANFLRNTLVNAGTQAGATALSSAMTGGAKK